MKLISLYLENFFCYSKTTIDFTDIKSAIILGNRKDNENTSNGVGKSSIFVAIDYALFGELPVKLEKLVRRGCDTSKVQLEFEIDKVIYRISRIRNKKGNADVLLEKKVGDAYETNTQLRNSDTNAEIKKIIKINRKSFINSNYFIQRAEGNLESDGIAALTPEKRKDILKDCLQLSNYIKLEKLAKAKTNDILKNIESNNIILKTLEDPEKQIKEISELLKTNNNLLNDIKDENKKILNDKSILENKYNELINNININTNKSDQFIENKKQLTSKHNQLQTDITKFTAKINLIADEGKKISEDITNIKSKLNILKVIDTQLLKEQNETLSEILINEKSNLKQLEIKYNKLNSEYSENSLCDECNQIISKDHIDKCKQEANNILNLINDIKLSIDKNTKLFNTNKNDIINNDNNIKLYNDYSNKNQILQSQLKEKKSQYKEYTELVTNYKESLELIKQEMSICNESSINNIINIINEDKKSLQDVKIKLNEINVYIDGLNKKITSINSTIAVLQDRLKQNKDNLKKKTKIKLDLEELNDKYKIHQKVCEAFSTTGIPNLIIHTILEDLQTESNNILNELYPGLQLKFNIAKDNSKGEQIDTLDIVYYFNGHESDFLQLSGGQRLMISLSLRLGLSNIMYKKLGIKLQFLLLDEVDQALDKASLNIFVDLVKKLQNDFLVLVITHNDYLKDKFSNAILIEQDETFSSTASIIKNY